jgi:hypothetical protein
MPLKLCLQDVSSLVDVCRQSIVFQTVENITVCLASIAEDPDVRVLRIKNRLDPGFDARRSAGYRDVAINIQIISAQTKALGIDSHVCELQLMLQSVAELKVSHTYPSHSLLCFLIFHSMLNPSVKQGITLSVPMM